MNTLFTQHTGYYEAALGKVSAGRAATGRIAILLSTWNGERHLIPLLESIIAQSWTQWDLWVRDDGSTDGTIRLLEQFSQRLSSAEMHDRGNRLYLSRGKNMGVVKSFFNLLEQADDDYIGYAFCDQDDRWLPDKLERAAEGLAFHASQGVSPDGSRAPSTPFLYHGRQWIADDERGKMKLSPLPVKVGFPNALIQNQVVGCTMVINPAMRSCILNCILEPAGSDALSSIILHDWWCYLIASGTGTIQFDPDPVIIFRRHEQSSTPAASAPHRSILRRMTAIRNRGWTVSHILDQAEVFARCHAQLRGVGGTQDSERLPGTPCILTREKERQLQDLLDLRNAGFFKRLRYLFSGGHERASRLDTLLFRLFVLFCRY
ncbi:MAG: glycosyltransferase family 2 protein [Bacteroidota bacterium]